MGARSGDARNGLTGIAVDAVAAIAERHRKARPAARDALVRAYPPPAADAREARRVEALAKRVHDALSRITGKRVPFPRTYDAAAREKLGRSW